MKLGILDFLFALWNSPGLSELPLCDLCASGGLGVLKSHLNHNPLCSKAMLEGQCSVVGGKKGPTSTRLIVIKQPYSKAGPMNKSANPSIRGMCLNLNWKECFGFTGILCVRLLCVCGCVSEYAIKLGMNTWIDPRLACFTYMQEFCKNTSSAKNSFNLTLSWRSHPT